MNDQSVVSRIQNLRIKSLIVKVLSAKRVFKSEVNDQSVVSRIQNLRIKSLIVKVSSAKRVFTSLNIKLFWSQSVVSHVPKTTEYRVILKSFFRSGSAARQSYYKVLK